jgi:anti-sigma regulatory factor (Ser/Thr protein kinase)
VTGIGGYGDDAVAPRTAELAADVWLEPYGLMPEWPAALRAVTRTLLEVAVPMALACGPEFVLVYNDAYARQFGSKHPEAFGQPAGVALAENWSLPGHGDRVENVYRTGKPFVEADTSLPVRRRGPEGPVDQVYFSRSYTAVRDDDGTILAVLAVISETTGGVRALAGIGELAGRLARAASVDDVARDALRHAITVIGADHARVLVSDDTATLRMTRMTRAEASDESDARLPPLWSVLPPEITLPSADAVRTGRPLWLGEDAQDRYPALLGERLGGIPLRTVAALPFDTPIGRGAIALGWEHTTPFDPGQRSALGAVAGLVGHAMSRASRFDEQLHVSDALQRAMLPGALPHLPGLSLAARYLPSAPGTSAGGDFYDAFSLPDGRLVVTIGDVVGHGVEAAATMGQVRAALRVALYSAADVGAALDQLDPLITGLGDAELFVTALVAVLDAATGRVDLASAGHPTPLLTSLRESGAPDAVFVDVAPGPPLGIAGARPVTAITMPAGTALVAFTDGLVERRNRSISDGLEELRAVAAKTAGTDPRRLCGLLTDQPGCRSDDVAVLVVARDDQPRRTASFAMAGETEGPARVRHWAAVALSSWGIPVDVVDTALLCLSELTTNALLHARGGAHVEIDADVERLLLEVSDAGVAGTLTAQLAAETDVRGRGLALVDALSTAWGAETHSHGTNVWCELALPRPPEF